MPDRDISATKTSDLTNNITEFSVAPETTEGASGNKETEWMSTKWSSWLGYYKKIPELKKAIDAFATWVIGKGYETEDNETKVVLNHITGWGEDTFQSVLWNMIVTKKIGGDAFAEIIRDEETGELLNLKPLEPGIIKIIVDEKGLIKRYEQTAKTPLGVKTINTFHPNDILHLCNDRIADEIHGISVVEACEQIILMRNEAMTDYRKVLHRNINPLKIFELDTDDPTKRDDFIKNYQNMTKDYEALFVPKGNASVTIPNVPIQDPIRWIQYLENFFYQAVGIPKVILGGSSEFTEASSKISYLTFEQIYAKEQVELEKDLWGQIGIKITFNKPASLKSEMLSSEDKNTGQVAMQPNDMMAGVGA